MVGEILTVGDINRLQALSGNAAVGDRIPIVDVSAGTLRYATPDQIASGASAVDGPASATDNAIARFDGITGKIIQNSAVTVADTTGAIASGNITTTGTGGSVFNSTALDSDFTVKAITSGNAISYDAGTSAIALAATTVGVTGAVTITGAVSQSGSTTYTTATSGTILKQGANGRVGTFVANGATPVTVNNSSIAITDAIIISLNTVGGTVGVQPHVATITGASGFTVVCTATDTSTYNYAIIKNVA